jgi:hypothetical protein
MDRRPDKDDKSVDKLCTAMFSFNDFRNFSRTLLHDKLLLARRKLLGASKETQKGSICLANLIILSLLADISSRKTLKPEKRRPKPVQLFDINCNGGNSSLIVTAQIVFRAEATPLALIKIDAGL